MQELKNIRISRYLLIIVLLLYFFAYAGRYSYNTTIVNMVSLGILTKIQSGLLTSVFYIVFTVGSLFSAFVANKRYSYIILTVTAIGTAVCNVGFYFTDTFVELAIFYSLNALCQSLMFTPIFAMINNTVMDKHRRIGVKYFSVLYPLSRLLDNIMVIFLTLLGNYKYLYLFCAAACTVSAVIWLLYWVFAVKPQYGTQKRAAKSKKPPPRHSAAVDVLAAGTAAADVIVASAVAKEGAPALGRPKKNQESQGASVMKILVSSGFIFILLIAVLRCMLNSGTNSWLPTMILETFGITPLVSQLTTLVFPLLNVSGIYLGLSVQQKTNNEIFTAGIFFALCLPVLFGLLFMKSIGFGLSLILFSVLNVVSYGFFVMLNSSITACFRKTGKLSVFTALMSAGGSVGFIISGVLFGWVADISTWTVIIIVWIGLAALAALLSFAVTKRWGRFRNG